LHLERTNKRCISGEHYHSVVLQLLTLLTLPTMIVTPHMSGEYELKRKITASGSFGNEWRKWRENYLVVTVHSQGLDNSVAPFNIVQ
jgi:hypothetical protein